VSRHPIKVDPEIMGGTPCFAGTRVPIRNLFDLLSNGRTLEYFLVQLPTVSRKQPIRVLRESRRRAKTDAAMVRG